ncbi:kinesin-like protein KIF3C isoform X1 [Tursiops truncatus]|uniref:Kinesin-like protein n=1 Tax=Tursiops truncatus TaxID=9739 RepID=A0A6J3PXN3_TURTR|nr:kinesin-like protein KIF3C isoform X1 [Tursiops truncatus]XP_033694802.1 kinesin-like protein KIF3C isoform X1 [Tursiops truncatus]XP_033694803.1 kinesin-like protein KIF3C isoform X1 [Tursiops truncatus]XP_033694804.1 kinesin-like protein KIF3C isoform X1 [Tursiops truncatus]
MASKTKASEALKVVARCRPLSRKEEASGHEQILTMDVKLGQVTLRNPRAALGELPKTFTFDAVYDASSKQADLYDETVRPLVDSVLQGFNGTVFAYGQTGTGKTYTMQGTWVEPEQRGVIPNAFEHIFTHISRSQNQQYLVRASYLEIYQEEIRDLLSKEPGKRLELKENPETGVYIKDLSSFVTKNVKEIEHVMNLGNQTRAVGSTHMNEVSSRSHAIFVITVECSERGLDGQDHIRVGKLNLVDLAGSERQNKAGPNAAGGTATQPTGGGGGGGGGGSGERPKEASKINLSLSALGNVIAALAGNRSTHIPYRDSKLTRLLQDSLGGNAKTIMVATLGPASHSYDESLSTLRFANRAKNIKNKPRVNEDPKDTLLREFQEEIARLKAQLEKKGMLGKRLRRKSSRRKKAVSAPAGYPEGPLMEAWVAEEEDDNNNYRLPQPTLESALDKNMENYLQEQKEQLEEEKAAIQDDRSLVSEEKQKLLEEKEKMLEDLRREQQATELLAAKYKAMESKLLIGGRNIMDHTNEQQKMLELKRQEIAEQKRREREMQQEMMLRDEETMELRGTYTSLQQEVEVKTKKLKKLYAKLQAVKAEIQDQHDEYIRVRQDLEEAQNEQTRELKLKYLIIENFIPPEEKNKIMNRLFLDCEEEQWKFQPLMPGGGSNSQMKKRPTSAVGYKRPISQYARVAMAMGSHPRYRVRSWEVEGGGERAPKGGDAHNLCFLYLPHHPCYSRYFPSAQKMQASGPVLTSGLIFPPQAENIMFLELDVSPPAVFEMEFSHDQEQDPRALHMERLMRLDSFLERPSTSKVRKSRSWCQSPQRPPPSIAHASLASAALLPTTALDHE